MVHDLNKNSVFFFIKSIPNGSSFALITTRMNVSHTSLDPWAVQFVVLISKLPSISAIGSSLCRFHSLTLPSNELDAKLIIAGSCVNVDCGCQLIQQAFTI